MRWLVDLAAIHNDPSGSATFRSATSGSAPCWSRRATGGGHSRHFRRGLAIREALAERDPANTEWQRRCAPGTGGSQPIGEVCDIPVSRRGPRDRRSEHGDATRARVWRDAGKPQIVGNEAQGGPAVHASEAMGATAAQTVTDDVMVCRFVLVTSTRVLTR
jgi:hypothetical protein